ncbi:hypothetical protein HK104_002873 [Borealophlyctis nickersoniae]|nr:hypothetical protein HK104_002873 [Borealophlyctis nickersoniae]
MATLPTIFQDASHSAATHRKNVVVLRKLHLRAKSGADVNAEFFRVLCRLLLAKKGNHDAERAMKFFATYLDELSNAPVKGSANPQQLLEELVDYLLKKLVLGFNAADKTVRYRTCQLTAILLNYLEEMDDDMYNLLTPRLLERCKDKEAIVRLNAANALSRLQDAGSTDEEDALIRETMLDMLRYDPSPDVRKCLLWIISVNKDTLPDILTRARDVDPNVRKAVFLKISTDVEDVGDLTVEERDDLLHYGLSDRDAGVKKASLRMLCEHWIKQSDDDLVDFLKKIDVMSGAAAEDAVQSFLMANPAVNIPYNEEMWDNLDIESVFFLRAYIAFCAEDGKEDALDEALPPLYKHVQYMTKLVDLLDTTEEEDAMIVYEFILGQLLRIAELQDFSDEMGRRDMLVCLRDMACNIDLPEEHLLVLVKTIRRLATSEKDYTRIMVEEVLRNIHDVDEDEEQAEGADQQAIEIQKAVTLSKCLDIVKCILQCAEENLSENAIVRVILQDFIYPAVQHPNMTLRVAGVHCLGLCCILDKELATEKMPLFIHAFKTGDEKLASLVLMIIFDIIISHGAQAFWELEIEGEYPTQEIVKKALECDNESILTLATEGLSKLMMLSYVKDAELLQRLCFLYFHPYTKNMSRLRQCLSYFFPVFAHSSHRNQKLLQEVFMPAFRDLVAEAQQYKGEMISPLHIGQQLIDWTDSRKVVRGAATDNETVDDGLHAQIAIDLLTEAIMEKSQAVKKIYCQCLNKLHLGTSTGVARTKKLALLVGSVKEVVAGNTVAANALKRFSKVVIALDEEQMTEEEYRELVQDNFGLREQAKINSDTEEEDEEEDEDGDSD